MTRLAVSGLAKRFAGGRRKEDVVALDSVSLEVEAGRLVTILGPSGCGKTTMLRCIAGLETPDAGEIRLGERVLFSAAGGVEVPASARGLGMVFQSYAIWPHMSAFDNVAFPLAVVPRRSRLSRRAIRERVERALATVRLEHLAGRPATDLSGGEQQRLALARALVMEPPLVLLDEPLSNLDAKLREEMRFELARLQRELGITAVYVTHDQVEALAISSAVAVMRAGRIEQVGTPREIYERPASRFVADFIGAANLLDGVVEGRNGNGSYAVRTAAGALAAASGAELARGAPVTVVVRPERIAVVPAEAPSANGWRGVVEAVAFLGDAVDHVIRVGPCELRARTTPAGAHRPGEHVALSFEDGSCLLLDGSR